MIHLGFLPAFLMLFCSVCFAQSALPNNSRLSSIVKDGVIRMAYRADAKPFSFVNENSIPAGFTIDLCTIVANSIKRQFGMAKLDIEWIPVTLQTRFETISNGGADLECSATSVSSSRMEQIDFSALYFIQTTSVMVLRNSSIQYFSDFAGRKIAVAAGTTNVGVVAKEIARASPSATIVLVKDRDDGMVALEAGSVDGLAGDKMLLLGTQIKNANLLRLLPEELSIEKYAIALPHDDWALRLAINRALSQVYASGEIRAIFDSWFKPYGMRPGPLLEAAYELGRLPE